MTGIAVANRVCVELVPDRASDVVADHLGLEVATDAELLGALRSRKEKLVEVCHGVIVQIRSGGPYAEQGLRRITVGLSRLVYPTTLDRRLEGCIEKARIRLSELLVSLIHDSLAHDLEEVVHPDLWAWLAGRIGEYRGGQGTGEDLPLDALARLRVDVVLRIDVRGIGPDILEVKHVGDQVFSVRLRGVAAAAELAVSLRAAIGRRVINCAEDVFGPGGGLHLRDE